MPTDEIVQSLRAAIAAAKSHADPALSTTLAAIALFARDRMTPSAREDFDRRTLAECCAILSFSSAATRLLPDVSGEPDEAWRWAHRGGGVIDVKVASGDNFSITVPERYASSFVALHGALLGAEIMRGRLVPAFAAAGVTEDVVSEAVSVPAPDESDTKLTT